MSNGDSTVLFSDPGNPDSPLNKQLDSRANLFFRFFKLDILEEAYVALGKAPQLIHDTAISKQIGDSEQIKSSMQKYVVSHSLYRAAAPQFLDLTRLNDAQLSMNYPWLCQVENLKEDELVEGVQGFLDDSFYDHIVAFINRKLFNTDVFIYEALADEVLHGVTMTVYDNVVMKARYGLVWRLYSRGLTKELAAVLRALSAPRHGPILDEMIQHRTAIQLALTLAADNKDENAFNLFNEAYTYHQQHHSMVYKEDEEQKDVFVKCLLEHKLPVAEAFLRAKWHRELNMPTAQREPSWNDFIYGDPCHEGMFDTRVVRYYEGGRFATAVLMDTLWTPIPAADPYVAIEPVPMTVAVSAIKAELGTMKYDKPSAERDLFRTSTPSPRDRLTEATGNDEIQHGIHTLDDIRPGRPTLVSLFDRPVDNDRLNQYGLNEYLSSSLAPEDPWPNSPTGHLHWPILLPQWNQGDRDEIFEMSAFDSQLGTTGDDVIPSLPPPVVPPPGPAAVDGSSTQTAVPPSAPTAASRQIKEKSRFQSVLKPLLRFRRPRPAAVDGSSVQTAVPPSAPFTASQQTQGKSRFHSVLKPFSKLRRLSQASSKQGSAGPSSG
ncbi:hypothetical protein IWQ60_003869 [Tieghemiomyces parasiticus]|uniref:Uncharacterized protein n=1 Tax=Tieghemiomyces parasiticus TaxID=78921 RepID=A0A9W8AGS3_9FUNG|nr:hypothetical protein IWQ60_003869 [Tieghemiomyces parasiticus]